METFILEEDTMVLEGTGEGAPDNILAMVLDMAAILEAITAML